MFHFETDHSINFVACEREHPRFKTGGVAKGLIAAPSIKCDLLQYSMEETSNAEIHIVDGGHFALDIAADEIAVLVRSFILDAAVAKQMGLKKP
jgi:hypothetical protein